MKLPCKYSKLKGKKRREVREAYIKEQDGRCWHCGGILEDTPPEIVANKKITPKLYPIGFFSNPVHLHHDHFTDLTLGAVHAHCNAVLWEYFGQ